MQVQQNNNVNFGARFINPATIKIKNDKGRWVNETVSFIKFDTAKKSDITALEGLERLWGGKNLSGSVADEARILGGKAHIYAITSQSDNFESVRPKDILGVMTTDKAYRAKGDVEIFKIGSEPSIAYEQNHRQRPVRHVAKALVQEFVRLLNRNKDVDNVIAHSDFNDRRFLDRVGFKLVEDGLAPKYAINKTDFSEFIG